MKKRITQALLLTINCIIFFSGFYTLFIWGVARLVPNKCEGFIVQANGKKYYSNIGQKFTDDKYFWSRPSAVDYNAAGSGGSNKGPGNPEYLATVQQRIDSFLKHNQGIKKEDIPSELVTASGSGLDPDITVQAALIQAPRIAKTRNIATAKLTELITKDTDSPLWEVFGPKKINVLKLNTDLDDLK